LPAARFNLLLNVNKVISAQQSDNSSDYPWTDDKEVYRGAISVSVFDYEQGLIVGMSW
jgi:hypothetical protein